MNEQWPVMSSTVLFDFKRENVLKMKNFDKKKSEEIWRNATKMFTSLVTICTLKVTFSGSWILLQVGVLKRNLVQYHYSRK